MKNIAVDGKSIKQPVDIFFDVFKASPECPLNEGSTRDFTVKMVFFMFFLTLIQQSFETLHFEFLKMGTSMVIYLLAIILIARYIKLLNKKVRSHNFIGLFGVMSILVLIIAIMAV